MVELLVRESELLFSSLDLIHEFTLIESLLGHDLPSQVLDLRRQSLLYGIVLLTHDFAPDSVQFVQDLANAGLVHLPIELLFYLQDGTDSLCRDPIIVFDFFFLLRRATLHRLVVSGSRSLASFA